MLLIPIIVQIYDVIHFIERRRNVHGYVEAKMCILQYVVYLLRLHRLCHVHYWHVGWYYVIYLVT